MDILKIDQKLDRIERLLLNNKTVLTLEEASDYTGFSKSDLYKKTSKGIIPFSKPNGKFIFFSKEKLDKWLLNNHKKTNSEIEKKALSYTLKNKRS